MQTSLMVMVLAGTFATQMPAQDHPPQPAQHAANPTVSPDGRRIAFMSDRASTGDFFVMNADGSGVQQVTTDGGHRGHAYWSADGKHLIFSVSAKDSAHVMSVALSGGPVTQIAQFEARSGAAPSSDGSHFVFGVGPWSSVQLVAARADGSSRVALTSDKATYFCQNISLRGDRVVAARTDSAGSQVFVVNMNGSDPRIVTHFTAAEGSLQCPAWSPDGRRIAVQGEAPDPSDSSRSIGHIWIVDYPAGRGIQLARHAAPFADELPEWFPDGKRIVFQSDRTGRWEIWVMNADGSGQRQITN